MEKEKIRNFLMQVGPLRLILVGICGIFLILVSLPDEKGGRKTISETTEEIQEMKQTEKENETYTTHMEQRLKKMLEKMEGVGKAEVMITLLSSRESVVNKDTPYEEEKEEQEGNEKKISSKKSGQEETVLIEEDGNQVPFVLKQYEPEVEGVIAVIEGGDDPVTVSRVTEAIQALFHVEVHKIKVLKMEDGT